MVCDQLDECTDEMVERTFRWFYFSINAGAVIGQFISPILHHFGPKIVDGDGVLQGTSFYLSFMIPSFMFVLGSVVFMSGIPHYRIKEPKDNLFGKSLALMHKAWQAKYSSTGEEDRGEFLDWALDQDDIDEHTEKFVLVEDLKLALRPCRVFLFFPIYWLLYSQMQT